MGNLHEPNSLTSGGLSLNSGEPIEADDAFWNRLRAETDRMAAEHQARKVLPRGPGLPNLSLILPSARRAGVRFVAFVRGQRRGSK